MPNRLIREGWLDSEAIDRLEPDAERLFLRLCLTADDAGRFDGRMEILRARLYPLKISLRASDVAKWLDDCIRQGLVFPYECDGKPFLQISKVQRSSPAVNSKFPWKDGSHKIVYVERETRDGAKEFVSSSMTNGIAKGSIRVRNPSDPPPSESPGTGTGSKSGTGTTTAPSGTVEPPKKGYEAETPIQQVVAGFKIQMGTPLDDRAWDKVYFRRYSKPASELLTLFGGDVKKCLDCTEAVSKWLEKKSLSWAPETVVKHASDWKNGRLGK